MALLQGLLLHLVVIVTELRTVHASLAERQEKALHEPLLQLHYQDLDV